MSDKRANLLGEGMILINKSLESDEHNGVIHVTTQDSFAALVSNLLEELVFRWLKGLVKVMVVLDIFRRGFQSVDRSDFESKLFVTLTDMFENCSGRNRFQASETLQELLGIGFFSSHDECMTAHIGLVEANKLRIKDTIFEAIAMYKRSRAQNEAWLDAWPTIEWFSAMITDEVCDAVRKVDGAIECGIRQVHENPLAAQCSTGSKIRAMGVGTLRGFAMKDESTLAFLARHVVGEENDSSSSEMTMCFLWKSVTWKNKALEYATCQIWYHLPCQEDMSGTMDIPGTVLHMVSQISLVVSSNSLPLTIYFLLPIPDYPFDRAGD
ncbi:hypothetical protein DPMN_071064 [Dreissena polymorpha]|uniref:Uncharacterized protein n=1 Tax=Dreissena polymorpha TaxID=45954 RepID=A0A9D4BVG7_DREPO|nr:hypothetical protein DPMN_071064 [Dreissena polymorpha]